MRLNSDVKKNIIIIKKINYIGILKMNSLKYLPVILESDI